MIWNTKNSLLSSCLMKAQLFFSIVLYSETDHFLALIKLQINIQTAAYASAFCLWDSTWHFISQWITISLHAHKWNAMWAPAASMTAEEINLYWTIAGVRVWMWRVKLHLVSFIVCGGARRPEFSSVWHFCLLYNKWLASFPVSFSRWKCAIRLTFPRCLLTFTSTGRVHEILIGFLS